MKIESEDGLLSLVLPSDWEWRSGPEGHAALCLDPPGVLHVTVEAVEDAEQLPNLSRMLAGFLTHQVKPILTDELVPWNIEGARGFAWQYKEEAVEGGDLLWRVWIFGNRKAWAFVSFNCPLQSAAAMREPVDEIVASLRVGS